MSTYPNTFLTVNLSTERQSAESIPDERVPRYFLGSGLAASLYYDQMRPDLAPLDPQSPVYIFVGLLTGTMVPTACKFSVCGRSPLTGVWNESVSGGDWGAELRFTGHSGIAITGRSSAPVYLWVDDSGLEIRDASHLWGLDCYETADRLRAETDPQARVLAIGPAGERLVNLAALMVDGHEARAVGRGGMGAVLGSKNLKAIVVKGSQRPTYRDEESLRASVREKTRLIRDNSAGMSKLGTAGGVAGAERLGDLPLKNWLGSSWPEGAAAITGQTVAEQYTVKHYRCFGCPIGCGKQIPDDNGEFIHTPEYETAGSLGALCLVDDLPSIIRANDICNRLGLDTISVGASIAAAMEAFERGLLPKDAAHGLDLSWGNAETMVALTEQIGLRQGLGTWLGEGVRAFSRRLGRDAADLDITVKGLELPMHDPRGSHGMGLAYMMSNRGACHNAHLMHPIEQGMAVFTEVGFEENYDGQSDDGKAEAVRLAEDYGVQCSAIPLCVFDHWTYKWDDPFQALNAVTGWGLDLKEYLRTGARIWLIKRALINRMGITAADDRLPVKVLTAATGGGAAGSVPDAERLRREYYQQRGLDERGWPTRETLAAVGLDDVADVLYA